MTIYSPNSLVNPNDPNSFEKKKKAIGLAGIAVENAAQVGQGAVNAATNIANISSGVFDKTKNFLGNQLYGDSFNTPSINSNQRTQGAAGTQSTSRSNIDYSGTAANTKSSITPPITPNLSDSNTPSVFRSGNANISQTSLPNNKSTINFENGVGGSGSITSNKVFTPQQLDSLSKTIDYNNKPETIANFAKQAAISQARYDDARSKGYFGSQQDNGTRDSLVFGLQNAINSDNQKATALFKDLIENYDKTSLGREGLGVQREENAIKKQGIEANLNSDTLKSQQNLLDKANEARFKFNKEQQDAHQKGLGAIIDLKKSLASPLQQLAGYTSFSGRQPNQSALDFILSDNPDYQQALKLGDTDALKKVMVDEGIPEEYLGSIFPDKQQ